MSDKRAESQPGREREREELRGESLFEWWQNVLACRQCARQRLHFMCPATAAAGAAAAATAAVVAVLNKAQTEDHKALELKLWP